MIIERDASIPLEDGLVLRADVFRPDSGGPHPVVMTLGPYGKGVRELPYLSSDPTLLQNRVSSNAGIS